MSSSSRRPIVAQASGPEDSAPRRDSHDRPVTPPNLLEDKAPFPSTRPKPLLEDVSLYTNNHIAQDTGNTTLEELAHLVRLSKYQERKRASTRTRLQRTLVSTALSARLTRCGEIAHRNLVESFRRDEKENFASLYNAIHDVRKSCDELRRYALLEPDLESLASPILGSPENPAFQANSVPPADLMRPMVPFLDELTASSRDTFLGFLTELRTNPDFLATRICALTSSELNAFLTFHKGLEPVESVLPFHGRQASRSHASASARSATNVDIERLLSFQRHDPLSILIHTCFANSAGPDSSEDQRRTEIWATALARLISEPKSTGEHFLISVLNIWTAMRDWSGRANMEWYLMKILKEGAFLLERAEDQHGTRFNLSDWNQADEVAAREFYDRAVDGLFEVVDDDDATGIPEGLLELGNAILNKLSHKYIDNTSRWLVWRCLFFVFLLGVIIHPESYGMLVDYHITPYAREKILRKVAMKAHEYVSSMWSGKPSATCVPVETPPKIKAHVENILARFQGSRSRVPAAKLLPARSVTSLRETVEVHPYLVLSPADMATLVNALFPERRPLSATSNSLRSGPPSVSGMSAISQTMPTGNPRNSSYETASIISTSASSIFSDATTSREALRDGLFEEAAAAAAAAASTSGTTTPQRYSPEAEAQMRRAGYEDDGYRLRLALHELGRTIGPEALRGSCHPCAERWMVLFVSTNGKNLSTHMTYDPDDDLDDAADSSSNADSDDEEPEAAGPLDKDYHQLRSSILKLVEDYEIPRNLENQGSTPLSNRASGLKKYKSRSKIITPEKTMSSRNPYRRQMQQEQQQKQADAKMASVSEEPDSSRPRGKDEPESDPVLVAMLKSASSQSRAQADFVSAHMYWKTLRQLQALESPSLRQDGFATLINILSRGPRDSIRRSAAAIEEYDAWLIWLKQSQERHEGLIDRMMRQVGAIRDKMWYVTDVRNSKEYTHSRDICQALRTMGMPRRSNPFSSLRANIPRGASSASYLYRAESQIMDLLAASEEQGGPNKLSDDQAELTTAWLQQLGIENFCQGEERIHRFSCEVDRCISKLIGETVREAPVLWSSELYRRDKIVYDRLRARERELSSPGGADDAASIISGEGDRKYGSSSGRGGSSLHRDMRSVSGYSSSQLSLDASRHGIPRASAPLSDILDGPDYLEKSPVHAPGDAAGTFWSPFQPAMSPGSGNSRAYSPTTSLTNLSTTFSGHTHHTPLASSSSYSMGRPGTSASSNETINNQQQRADDEKTRFLSDLRRSLTSLLLSDLGSQVLSKGSETDAWFNKTGQQCIDRKDAFDRRAKRRSEKKERYEKQHAARSSTTRPRVIEKKKSFGNLRGAGDTDNEASPAPSEASTAVGRSGRQQHVQIQVQAQAHGPVPSQTQTPKDESPDFPFRKAYERLLNMFCVHSCPHAKLNALNELENLIVASLSSSGSKKSRWNRSDAGSSVAEEYGPVHRPTPLEGTIDNVRERRSHTLQAGACGGVGGGGGGGGSSSGGGGYSSRQGAETRSIVSSGASTTDAITRELQKLFRDASIRPKTLFRDLQLIASFVPPSVLERPERGRAFWNAGLAALKLKSEVCRTMMEMADEVVAAHTHARKASAEAAVVAAAGAADQQQQPQSQTSTPPPPSTSYRLEDAGRMWTITAKEGYPTAQRELALFYLSNPESVERTTLPLSKPREVFKQVVMEKYGRGPSGVGGIGGGLGVGESGDGAGGGVGEGDVRNDAGLMCVAVHWMEAAERGGDELATSFLRQNEFMGR
ncbi:hypothetical protein GMORB2_2718 [Geosmithia morbida]|uniref:Uncharacterized protein n=1 Tax=Geosmithia morbida TaxID=1094350 RepID=A0A9P4YS02_9HYPO|nr:uncharacterized protein GMORB2_2718 [Geosmithia morbida]KAF4120714.1 hypothetical protein GMORB2_2718 [Geosmithia morbida]